MAQTFPKVAQIGATIVFTLHDAFQNRPKSNQCFWDTFASKFVAKNFLKLPNLVTLDVNEKWGLIRNHSELSEKCCFTSLRLLLYSNVPTLLLV